MQGLTEVSWHPSVCRHLSLNDSSSQRKWVNSLTETEKSKEGCVSSVCADWIITVCHSNLSNMLITLSGQTLGHRPTPCTRRSWTLNRRTASHVQFCFHRQNQKCLVQEMLFSRMFGTVKLDGCYWDIHRAFWINVTCYKNQLASLENTFWGVTVYENLLNTRYNITLRFMKRWINVKGQYQRHTSKCKYNVILIGTVSLSTKSGLIQQLNWQ